jgi:predicted GNAT family acetyltransferase
LTLVHTEVPDALGGRGVGGQLVRAALERAVRTGGTIAPGCRYARAWLEKHPDETAAATIDWSEPPTPD